MGQIVSLIVIILVAYLGSVFFLPWLASRVDSTLGLGNVSSSIHSAKGWLDSLWAPSESVLSGVSATGGLVDRAQDTIRQARDLYETTQMRVSEGRDFVDRKNAEFQALMDSMRQAKEIADKLQNDLDTLTTLSVSGSADTEASLRELEENMNEIRTLSGVVSGTASSSR